MLRCLLRHKRRGETLTGHRQSVYLIVPAPVGEEEEFLFPFVQPGRPTGMIDTPSIVKDTSGRGSRYFIFHRLELSHWQSLLSELLNERQLIGHILDQEKSIPCHQQ